MDAMLQQINSAGQAFVNYALPMLAQSSALIVVLLALDLVLRKKIRAVFRYWIWLIVLLKLVLPTTLSLPTSPAYWLADDLHGVVAQEPVAPEKPEIASPIIETPADIPILPEATLAARPVDNIRLDRGSALPVEAVVTPPPAVPASSVAWQGFVFLLWLAVVTVMTLLLVQRTFFVKRLIAQSTDAASELVDILEQARTQMKVRRRVALRLSSVAASPSVCGLFRPTILIPQSLAARLNSKHLRSIILHELVHIKRGDLWASLIQTILQIVYVYNPLLWVANAMIRKIREASVDEMVLVAMGEQAEDYPRTLLDVSRLTFSRPALSLRLIGVVESKKALAGRIRHMASKPFPRTAKLGMVGLLGVVVAALVLLPMAKGDRKDTSDPSSTETSSGKTAVAVSGIVTDKLGRPRGNVYIAPQSESIWKGARSDVQGRFVLEDVKPEQRSWVAFSHPSQAMGLFTIPQDYAGGPLGITLDFDDADAEGRVVGPDGKGLTGRKVEFVIKTSQGFVYHIPCYGKTDKHGNYYSHGRVPSGSGLTIQARLADASEAEKAYITRAVALRDSQIFVPMPRLVIGAGEPPETDDGKVLHSGRVVDEKGDPIQAVKVEMHFSWRSTNWVKEVRTDERGRWQRRLPKDISNLRIGLLHHQYIRQSWQKPSLAELHDGTNVTVMKRGVTLTGTVKNQQGGPVENALVDTGGGEGTTVYGEVIENYTTPRTLADGSFSVGGLAEGSMDIVVSAVGYAPQIVRLEIDDGMEPIDIRLKTGKTYIGQVVDVDGNPVDAVRVSVAEWQVGRRPGSIARAAKTDSQGYFAIENLPDEGKVRLSFGKRDSGLMGFNREIPQDLSDRDKIVMYEVPVFVGKVVDAETGKAIKNFTLIRGIVWSGSSDLVSWNEYSKKKVTSEDGTFTRTWGGYGIKYPWDGPCCLRVQAKGYIPGAARPMKLGEKYEPCVVRLAKGEPLTGTVIDPHGNPAAEAQIGLAGPKRFAFVRNGKFDMRYTYQAEPIVKANSDGIFVIPPSREQGLIVAVHKSGYASVESKDFKNGSQIRLTPWARIEGTIVSSRQNRGEFVLSIYEARPEQESESQQIRWMFDRTTFTGDNFVIDFVPSTPLNIGRVLESEQYNPVYIDPQPGETLEVRFGDEGIIAAGKKMPSLLGKPLPDLTDIAIVFSPERHKGKMILVCFWDMHQRPSRNCIAQLAGRAEQLSEEGVTVVAIQALKTDEKALDKWVRENGVPFPVGTVRADHEKTRTAWGVKSFPWLVLTDKNHVVKAEGFGLSELDQTLEANN